MAKVTKNNSMKVKKILKRDLSIRKRYKTTYKDIKKYFTIINKSVFNDLLSPFNEILIKKIYRDKSKNIPTWGQGSVGSGKEKVQGQFHLEMLPEYRDKRDFVETLGHEMVHLYQMANIGDTGNHNKIFYSFRPKLNKIGLDL
jgi:sensor c-di-GMP phosphodiesterase-like protein